MQKARWWGMSVMCSRCVGTTSQQAWAAVLPLMNKCQQFHRYVYISALLASPELMDLRACVRSEHSMPPCSLQPVQALGPSLEVCMNAYPLLPYMSRLRFRFLAGGGQGFSYLLFGRSAS